MNNKIIPVKPIERLSSTSQMDEHDKDRVNKLFKPFVMMIRIFGLFINRKSSGWRLVLGYILCIFLLCLMLANVGRFFTIFTTKNSTELYEQKISIANMMFYESGLVYLQVTFLISSTLHLPDFIRALQTYDRHYVMSLNFKKYTRITKSCATISLMSLIPLCLCGYVYMRFLINYWPESTITLIASPFHEWKSISGHILMFIGSTVHTFLTFGFTSMCFLYILVCLILRKEFSVIDERIGTWLGEENANEMEEKFEFQRQKHENIVRLASLINTVLQHLIFSVYATSIPITCLSIYGIINSRLSVMDMVANVQFLSVTLMSMATVTIAGILVHVKGHAPLDCLLLFDTGKMSNKLQLQIQLFVSRLTGQSIGFDMYGLLVVDKSIVLVLFGTIITYVVVVLQMR